MVCPSNTRHHSFQQICVELCLRLKIPQLYKLFVVVWLWHVILKAIRRLICSFGAILHVPLLLFHMSLLLVSEEYLLLWRQEQLSKDSLVLERPGNITYVEGLLVAFRDLINHRQPLVSLAERFDLEEQLYCREGQTLDLSDSLSYHINSLLIKAILSSSFGRNICLLTLLRLYPLPLSAPLSGQLDWSFTCYGLLQHLWGVKAE